MQYDQWKNSFDIEKKITLKEPTEATNNPSRQAETS